MEKKLKKTVSVLLSVIMILCIVPMVGAADDSKKQGINGFTYALDNYETEATITRYDTSFGKYVVIPSTIDGYPVVAIGTGFLEENKDVTGVSIPEGVREIESVAFSGCEKLSSVSLPYSIERVGENAFSSTAYMNNWLEANKDSSSAALYNGSVLLAAFSNNEAPFSIKEGTTCVAECAVYGDMTSISIPSSLNNISGDIFADCHNVQRFSVASGNRSYVVDSNGLLLSKDRLTIVAYPSGKTDETYVIPEGVKEIKENAFCNVKVKNLIIPDSVEQLPSSAIISDCEFLESITVPGSVKNVRFTLAYNCPNLKSVVFEEGVKCIGTDVPFIKNFYASTGLDKLSKEFGPVVFASFADGNNRIFFACPELSNISLPESLEVIGLGAFAYCTGLKSIKIPDRIKEIPMGAFKNCDLLSEVAFPAGLERIGAQAFRNCPSLKKLVIPGTVKDFGMYAFAECEALESVIFEEGISHIGNSYLSDCMESGTEPEMPYDIDQLSEWYYLNSIGIFAECTSLKNVSFPDSLKEIGDIFFNSTALEEVSIPANVEKVGILAFSSCKNLQKVTIYSKNISINKDAGFGYCDDDKTAKISDFTVVGYRNTDSERYAYENGFNFIALDGAPHKHDYNGKVTAEPSCTESGTKILTCFCGESYTETVSALGHTDADGNGYCDRCGDKIKSTDPSSGCSHICHKKGISSFFYKIARIFWKMFKTNQYCSCGAKHY